ncbi:MAG TPA: hypothetical protein VGN23_03970 [Verrucomicrobiae bacterium]|jgi:hypothetical protein
MGKEYAIAAESRLHSSRGQRPRGKSVKLSSPGKGIPLKPKNEKTNPSFSVNFPYSKSSKSITCQTCASKSHLEKRTQEPKSGKEKIRMKNEEKGQLLAIIRVVSRNWRKTLRLCIFLSRHSFRATADALKVANPTQSK